MKILFIDVDGTLKDELGQIPNSIHEVIDTCKQNNIRLCLCTGRSMGTIQEDVMQLPIENVIAGGGNYIQLANEVVYNDHFNKEEVAQFLKVGKRLACALALEDNETIFMNEQAEEIFLSMNRKYIAEMSLEEKQYYQENEKIVYQSNMEQLDEKQAGIHKICVWCDEEQFSQLQKHISNAKVVQQSPWGDVTYYELVKMGCDKGSAVKRVLDYFSLKKEESMCFGNGSNDIDMFHACEVAVAMADSDAKLIPHAHSVCEKASEDGILKELIRRGLR